MDRNQAKDTVFLVSIPIAVLGFAGGIISEVQEQYEAALACFAIAVFFAITAACLAPGVFRRHGAEEDNNSSLDVTQRVGSRSQLELTLEMATENNAHAANTTLPGLQG